ncbi:MAG: FtsH protease activity modulator HflK [Gammaproteobacteria bacterium]|nr:FtsH protease activity modulator HflK [Gammaproteobacteria bacterium]NIR84291.1 FtsH protease activity modulator HflK [Gammaproteobacteria bacterium]NIR89761.1 FtsH protease activity modulator HflK [Gammaproteobacteria bacterium]NIU05449.1 FtsH protease activity modulator HflK [Gammaproteobacteria bacterium]NIV52396.1 FtsH protease activity modulator HflK [Gammaproteobacteria bacterium]
MAWNQPGGNGGRDPWGNRGGQQGPPDLDEVLKKLQAALGRIFGGGGRSAGGGFRLGGGGAKGIGLIALVLAVIWGLAGIYIVDPPEQGVVLRFGEYVRTVGPGPHWLPYLVEDAEKVNVELVRSQDIGFRRAGGGTSSVPNEALMLTEDENIVDVQFTVQYRVKDPAKYLFNVQEPDMTLRQATESAVREIVGKNKMDFVLTEGRSAVAARAEELIQGILDRYGTGLQVTSVNMQSAQPPKEVQAAFADAVKAREDEERFKNEARAYAADIIPKARGDADAIRERALAYKERVVAEAEGRTDRFLKLLREYAKAPEVTRDRLYLEAVEAVLARSSKVLVDLEGGNNLIYLPLDKLVTGRGSVSGAGMTQLPGESRSTDAGAEQDAARRDRRLDIRGRSR